MHSAYTPMTHIAHSYDDDVTFTWCTVSSAANYRYANKISNIYSTTTNFVM